MVVIVRLLDLLQTILALYTHHNETDLSHLNYINPSLCNHEKLHCDHRFTHT